MRAEKIQKHMLRRTVVVGIYEDTNKIVGVLHYADICGQRAGMAGHTPDDGNMYNGYYQFDYIRKATADERAEFFAWLVSDGRDITDNFARFGGMPRGFEAWRAAQTPDAEPAPACAVGWMFTKPNPDVPWDEQDPACIPFQPHDEPEPVVTPQHKVGDLRVWLRSNGIGAVARITASKDDVVAFAEYKAYDADAVFEPTPENVARLVEQQRARGVHPNAGDLVFVVRTQREVNREIGIVSWCLEERDIKITSICDGGDDEESCYYPKFHDCHVLVIRRNPLREVADE